MTWTLDGQAAAVEQELARDAPRQVGWFRYYFDRQRWQWSDEVHRMHGHRPRTIELTTETVLSHKHPDDRKQVAEVIDRMTRDRAAFSTRHRIIDAQGGVRHVVVVGDLFCDGNGEVVGTHGFYLDVTPSETELRKRVTEGLSEIVEQRAVIEQAKGMLGAVYGLEDDAAFDLLVWLSQRTNQKVRSLAEQLVMQFRALSAPVLPERHVYDSALMALGKS